jgi:glyoxylate/hydroxypyruvate reductase A
MSAILVAINDSSPEAYEQQFRALAPARDIRLWPNRVGKPPDIAYACVWAPQKGLLAQFTNLKAILSVGAGVDPIIADPSVPNVPIIRMVDSDLTMRMTEYVVLHVLIAHRRVRLYEAQQRQRLWRNHEEPAASDVAVGVMGLGVLGRDAAGVLSRIGFRVAGWSRTARKIDSVETFHGFGGLEAFLARTEILVCLLPHTAQTDGILNRALFGKLKRDGALKGAVLINPGRGKLQSENDIIDALEEGLLTSATLDVFATEPLPSTSPLWTHPKITITPHNAAFSHPRAIVANMLGQIERFERGEPFTNVVNRDVGY